MTNDELQAVSTVIELKPGKKYLLVFEGDGLSEMELHRLASRLRLEGIYSIGIALRNGQELTVIEVPEV